MRLILNGGGAGDQIKESWQLFADQVNGGKVLYIPLAWNHGGYDDCLDWFKEEVSSFGIFDIEMVTSAEQITKEKQAGVKGVFVGGGNTYKLLKMLKDTDAFENLKEYFENDGLVMGGSAGAIIFGYSIDTCLDDGLEIESCRDVNLVGLTDTCGFDCMNGFSILPHYKKLPGQLENTKKRVTSLLLKGFKLICLPEETSIWITENQTKIIGQMQAELFDGQKSRVLSSKNVEQIF